MPNFDPNAILRGAQLTVVGAHRALQNPALYTSDHYRQAALAVLAGIAIRLIVAIPTLGVRALIWILGCFMDLGHARWDDEVIEGLVFIEHSVLQIPYFLMTFMRYVTPTLDNLFMTSLKWVDDTYVSKHRKEDPTTLREMYYGNLSQYPTHGDTAGHKTPEEAGWAFAYRYGRKAGISLAVFALSYLPYVGRFVLPAASFYSFNSAVGTPPALLIFGSAIFVPKRYLVMFLQSYFSSRGLMRELLEPYFSRIRYTKEQKRIWYRDREGVLFGFGVGFFLFLRIPIVGVLIYGIGEASCAYLITKVTDPPPPHSEWKQEAQDPHWTHKRAFLDSMGTKSEKLHIGTKTEPLSKQYT